MADSKASPRQKMINMMYLVLTALLALNVSAEILKAFHLVETSLETAGNNIENRNKTTFNAIEKYKKDHPQDAIAINAEAKAKAARTISEEAVKYFEALKEDLIAKTGGRHEDTNGDGKTEDEEPNGASNTEIHANYFMVENGGAKGKEVKDKINDYRTKLLNLVPEGARASIKSDLNTVDPPPHEGATISWESQMFEHTPLAAVLTLLTKTQNDVRNTEAQVLEYFRNNLTGDVVVISNFEAQIIPTNGTYVSQGSKFTADIFLAAASSQTDATVTVGGSNVKMENGIGKYEVSASGEGEKKFKAVITTKRASGKIESYEKEFTYNVVKPIAVISATKMNVVYIGLDNPISVSVPGYAASEVTPTVEPASGGTLTKSATGGYTLKVNGSAPRVKIVCTVRDRGTNATKRMGEQEYRVKIIPDPSPAIGTVEPGNVAAAVLRSQASVRAPLQNFAFEGVSFTAVEYNFVILFKRGGTPFVEKGKGPSLTPSMQAKLGTLVRGDRVIIDQLTVKGPGGNKLLRPIMYTIQ